nr:uncharacterized protein LOC121469255 [Taeniopygia guttata]
MGGNLAKSDLDALQKLESLVKQHPSKLHKKDLENVLLWAKENYPSLKEEDLFQSCFWVDASVKLYEYVASHDPNAGVLFAASRALYQVTYDAKYSQSTAHQSLKNPQTPESFSLGEEGQESAAAQSGFLEKPPETRDPGATLPRLGKRLLPLRRTRLKGRAGRERGRGGKERIKRLRLGRSPKDSGFHGLNYSSVKRTKKTYLFLTFLHLCTSLRWEKGGWRGRSIPFPFLRPSPNSGRRHRRPRRSWQSLRPPAGRPQPRAAASLRQRRHRGTPQRVAGSERPRGRPAPSQCRPCPSPSREQRPWGRPAPSQCRPCPSLSREQRPWGRPAPSQCRPCPSLSREQRRGEDPRAPGVVSPPARLAGPRRLSPSQGWRMLPAHPLFTRPQAHAPRSDPRPAFRQPAFPLPPRLRGRCGQAARRYSRHRRRPMRRHSQRHISAQLSFSSHPGWRQLLPRRKAAHGRSVEQQRRLVEQRQRCNKRCKGCRKTMQDHFNPGCTESSAIS